MKIRPFNDWILIRVHPAPEQKEGSIFLTERDPVMTAEVLAIGPGKPGPDGHRRPLDVRVGELVTFLRWHLEHQQGQQLKSSLNDLGADYALIKQDDILLAVEDLSVRVQVILPA